MRRVVVTGIGAVTPVGNNVPEFWEAIKNGKNGIAPITRFDVSESKYAFSHFYVQRFVLYLIVGTQI